MEGTIMSKLEAHIDPLHQAIYDRLRNEQKLEVLLASYGAKVQHSDIKHIFHRLDAAIQIKEINDGRGIAFVFENLPAEGSSERAGIEPVLRALEVQEIPELCLDAKTSNLYTDVLTLSHALDGLLEARREEMAKTSRKLAPQKERPQPRERGGRSTSVSERHSRS
jgi:hypothetical protein